MARASDVSRRRYRWAQHHDCVDAPRYRVARLHDLAGHRRAMASRLLWALVGVALVAAACSSSPNESRDGRPDSNRRLRLPREHVAGQHLRPGARGPRLPGGAPARPGEPGGRDPALQRCPGRIPRPARSGPRASTSPRSSGTPTACSWAARTRSSRRSPVICGKALGVLDEPTLHAGGLRLAVGDVFIFGPTGASSPPGRAHRHREFACFRQTEALLRAERRRLSRASCLGRLSPAAPRRATLPR